MPCTGERGDRIGTAPDARRGRKRAGEGLAGSVRTGICDHGLTNLIAEVHAGDDIAWKGHARNDSRPAGLIGHNVDGPGLVGEEVIEHRCGCCRGDGVFRRKGRTADAATAVRTLESISAGCPRLYVYLESQAASWRHRWRLPPERVPWFAAVWQGLY